LPVCFQFCIRKDARENDLLVFAILHRVLFKCMIRGALKIIHERLKQSASICRQRLVQFSETSPEEAAAKNPDNPLRNSLPSLLSSWPGDRGLFSRDASRTGSTQFLLLGCAHRSLHQIRLWLVVAGVGLVPSEKSARMAYFHDIPNEGLSALW
jgi:hypothetical protein